MSSYKVAKHRRWWTDVAGFFIWLAMQLVCMTLRIRSEREVCEDEYDVTALMAMWHNRNFVCPYAWNTASMSRRMGALTSASKDGALLESIVKHFGIRSYRGSSHRRGATVFLEAMQSVENGDCLAFAPDGPKGPIYKPKPGIVKLASLTGCPIVVIAVEYENCWRVDKAWDKYCIPKPFSRVNILWRKPFYIPGHLSDDELSGYLMELEELMKTGKPDFESLNTTTI